MISLQESFYHIINPSSKHRSLVKKMLEKNPSFRHHWVNRTGHPTHLETLVEWAVLEGYRKFAVWGGDGSFNRMLQALYDRDMLHRISVALVPVGTCNDFARKLGLQVNSVIEAFERRSTKTQPIDLGVMNAAGFHRVFINNAGFGRTVDRMNEKKSNAIKDIMNFNPKKLSIETTSMRGHEFQKINSYLMIVFNAPYFSAGMHFSKDIEPNDGTLNAFSVPPQTKVKLLMKFLKGRLGKPLGEDLADRFDGVNISVDSDSDLFVQVDGEPASGIPQRKLNFEVLPGKVQLLTGV